MDLRSKLQKLERRLSEAQKIILEQSQQIKKQSEEISRLQSILSEKVIKTTSSNSHLPPSKDLTYSSNSNQSLREKSTRPIGGQKGHKGHTLQMVDHPTQVEDLVSAYCNKCGGSLDSSSK